MRGTKIAMVLFVAMMAFVSLLVLVKADPTGPDSAITPVSSTRYDLSTTGQTTPAQAGNVSEININGTSVTQTWQGYFGNITGRIVLGDSNNNTFYDWNLASPNGEIYATRKTSTPVWSSIACASLAQVQAEDTAIGAQAADADSVSSTFSNATVFSPFYVGVSTINQTAQDCFATYSYNSTGAQSADFAEVLLHDSADIVYTAVISQDAMGFDGRTHDFQMLVGENGHNGDLSSTLYYFYLELE
jgi:hypothetical protein